ncbi:MULTISPECIES: PLD nuclease N-terminal domain-containing protein [unclassified Nocardiopsis]|uniref:PLD nuclease N-terminal domain-containing protein n=1 Tax=Nocardiopsis TaxID=2013 RepID=UPI00387AB10B
MTYLYLLFFVVALAVWVYALFDVVGSDADAVRLLPKPAWVVIVLLLPKLGALAWFALGRPQRAGVPGPVRPPSPFPEYDHPNRARGATPEDDAEFLRRCRERAEEQRRRAREQAERREQDGPDQAGD